MGRCSVIASLCQWWTLDMLNHYNTGGDYVMGVGGIDVGDVASNKV